MSPSGESESAEIVPRMPLDDIIRVLLADKRSENTRRAYAHDLREFFLACFAAEPDPQLVRVFLQQSAPTMVGQILRYKAGLLDRGLSEATVNRRMSAILSLLTYARRLGATEVDPGKLIGSEKVRPYRDTRGISREQARSLLGIPDRATAKGARDFAMLLLLLENALRRAEIVSLTTDDFFPQEKRIAILGKGAGTRRESVTLSSVAVEAILVYRACLKPMVGTGPLFCSVSPSSYGHGLTPDGLYKVLGEIARKAGVSGTISPHRLRHTAITMALDASGGDIRRVQRLSRHARLETLQIYDDNRSDLQGEMTDILSTLLHGGENGA